MKLNALMALAILALLAGSRAQGGGDQDHLVGCAGARVLCLWKTTPTTTFSSPRRGAGSAYDRR